MRTVPIDFKAIADETGIRRGKVCKSDWLGWCVQSSERDGVDMAAIVPPPMEPGETSLIIEGRNWIFT